MEMQAANIEAAIHCVCEEMNRSSRNSSWHATSESDLLFELVACILGSQVSYEIAQAATCEIRSRGLLEFPARRYSFEEYQAAIKRALLHPLHHESWAPKKRRYPFSSLRANHISRTVWQLYPSGMSLRKILTSASTAEDARREIVRIAVGIGPKQASLFLRNIGFTCELAILDSHVLRFMDMQGMMKKRVRSVSSMNSYEKHENNLRNYARYSGWSVGCLDRAIWIVMRVYEKGV